MKKIILITGVSSGIGQAFVHEAIKHDDLIIIGLGRHNIEGIKSKNFIFQKVDLNNESSIKLAIANIFKKFKQIDVLINNAGIGYRGTIEDMTMTEIRSQFEINFFGLIYLTKLVIPIMKRQKKGTIINLDSVASTVSTPTLGLYAATKSAVTKISEIIEQELNPYKIKVCRLIPGAVKTNFGKNIIEAQNIDQGDYLDLYEEWKQRFKSYFKIHNSSKDVALKLLALIKKPAPVLYMAKKDQLMCWLKCVLPKHCFNWLFLNFYYKYED